MVAAALGSIGICSSSGGDINIKSSSKSSKNERSHIVLETAAIRSNQLWLLLLFCCCTSANSTTSNANSNIKFVHGQTLGKREINEMSATAVTVLHVPTLNCIDNDIFPGNVEMIAVPVLPNAKVDMSDTGSALTLVHKRMN